MLGLLAVDRNSCWQFCSGGCQTSLSLGGLPKISLLPQKEVNQGAHLFVITNTCSSRSAQQTKNNLRTR